MDKRSIPMNLYLNDGDIDKTGYEQLKVRSFMKAAYGYPPVCGVTIGPNAVQNTKWDTYTPVAVREIKRPINSINSLHPTIPHSKETSASNMCIADHQPTIPIEESSEKREERLCRRKILAELENICYLESQERINQMRKEWMQREEITNNRIEVELEAEKLAREQKKLRELNAFQAKVSQMHKANQLNSPVMKKHAEDEEAIKAKELQLENEMKMLETKRMLKELDKIYNNEVLYREKYGEIAKIMISSNDSRFQASIAPEKDAMKTSNNEFLELIEKCKTNSISPEKVVKSYSLVSNIKKVYGSVLSKYEYFKKEIENEKKKNQLESELKQKKEEEKRKQEAKKKHDEIEKKKLQASKVADVETDRLRITLEHYLKYASPFKKTKESLKAFIADTSLKKFRSECQRAVNVPVNAISPTNAAHMNDKLKKLTSILSGQQIMVNSKLFIPNQHPLGVEYCTYFLAEKVVKQGEDVVSSQPDAAFSIAAVALAVWGDFPNFGNLLVAAFYEACPYLVPIYWEKEEGLSQKEYYKKLGFRYVDDERDDINMFLKKQGGISRLYFSLMVSHMKNRSKHDHPWGIWEAWRWIAVFTSLAPHAEISATMLLTMLEICGFALMKAYGKQFKKLLHLICVHYVPEVEKVTPPGSGGPVTRLKSFLENMIGNSSSLQPPKGLLQPNFW